MDSAPTMEGYGGSMDLIFFFFFFFFYLIF